MIVLIPVSRFRVRYEIAEGFPYSELDRMILQAVGEGITSIDNLVQSFRIHPRLLIQSLMGLIHTGWAALGITPDQQFVLTEDGKQALQQTKMPDSIAIRSRNAYILLERITGAVMPEGEVSYVSKKNLERKRLWAECVQLPSIVVDNRIDEGQVQYLLPRRQGQRLHWVGPIEMVSKGEHYIPVDVDLEREKIVNLSHRIEARLRPYIIEQAQVVSARLKKDKEESITWESFSQHINIDSGRISVENDASTTSYQSVPVSLSEDDLVLSTEQHIKLLYNVLETAETSIFISSADIHISWLETIRPALVNAMKRGVDIDLLWGEMKDKETLRWLKKLVYDEKDKPGQLRFNNTPAFNNAKFILWNTSSTHYSAVVGSFDWLSCNTNNQQSQTELCLGIKISHPTILFNLAWCAVAFWSGSRSETLSSVPDKWRRVATDLETLTEGTKPNPILEGMFQVTIRLVLDRENNVLMHELCDSAQVQLLLASSHLNTSAAKWITSVGSRNHDQEFTFQVLYGHTNTPLEQLASLHQKMGHASGEIRAVSNLNANVIVSDEITCISSYSFLSAPSESPRPFRELGVVIEGLELTNQVVQLLLDSRV